eukprot:CAMPEP_0173402858 /NCGR_PEP_ID=MMETSP1356-20130122/55140_1 /TAXON_ID=77927 ORGANISM="Hemiselmis virescens, Strain PCC157" /NCGR_SAMPLE_ID=MMETSP1356 /ASSEMBLY_ACC=CAM_ASM_000847 /LENGTH=31 /DNA_ID= /DNA_START= /DNA_END= /DNA_ORIENTATION=
MASGMQDGWRVFPSGEETPVPSPAAEASPAG